MGRTCAGCPPLGKVLEFGGHGFEPRGIAYLPWAPGTAPAAHIPQPAPVVGRPRPCRDMCQSRCVLESEIRPRIIQSETPPRNPHSCGHCARIPRAGRELASASWSSSRSRRSCRTKVPGRLSPSAVKQPWAEPPPHRPRTLRRVRVRATRGGVRRSANAKRRNTNTNANPSRRNGKRAIARIRTIRTGEDDKDDGAKDLKHALSSPCCFKANGVPTARDIKTSRI